jgi:RNA-directed DNA polymerase
MGPGKEGLRVSDIYREVRKMGTLEAAWRRVRTKGLQSTSNEIKAEVLSFDQSPYKGLASIQRSLREKTFSFAPQKGIAKKRPGKSARPIVIAPIENRIVQRAILDVLTEKCVAVKEVLSIPTSVGGIAGVDAAIALVSKAISDNARHYVRSDIPRFFTKINKPLIEEFILNSTGDENFTALFRSAVEVNLGNAAALGDAKKLFPTEDIGVAQGSALSPLIGNILLRDFDIQLNDAGRGVVCIRYIDDFVILAPTKGKALAAFRSACKILEKLQLEAYEPVPGSDKASEGSCAKGFDFLGCRIQPGLIQPSKYARENFIGKIQNILKEGRHAINCTRKGEARAGLGFAQTLCYLDRVIKGWGDAYSFSNGRQVFEALDHRIDQEVEVFLNDVRRHMQNSDSILHRRILGIHALKDTKQRELFRS